MRRRVPGEFAFAIGARVPGEDLQAFPHGDADPDAFNGIALWIEDCAGNFSAEIEFEFEIAAFRAEFDEAGFRGETFGSNGKAFFSGGNFVERKAAVFVGECFDFVLMKL